MLVLTHTRFPQAGTKNNSPPQYGEFCPSASIMGQSMSICLMYHSRNVFTVDYCLLSTAEVPFLDINMKLETERAFQLHQYNHIRLHYARLYRFHYWNSKPSTQRCSVPPLSGQPGFPSSALWSVVQTAQGLPVTCSPLHLSSRGFILHGET